MALSASGKDTNKDAAEPPDSDTTDSAKDRRSLIGTLQSNDSADLSLPELQNHLVAS